MIDNQNLMRRIKADDFLLQSLEQQTSFVHSLRELRTKKLLRFEETKSAKKNKAKRSPTQKKKSTTSLEKQLAKLSPREIELLKKEYGL